jgi:uncharacterized protein YutE (UPF0331/DUF86 family)
MVDKAKLDQMLFSLQAYTEVLRGLGLVPRDAFLANADKIGNAKYHFVIAIECCIDIANHIIASENYRFPKDNADSFGVLVEAAIVPPDLEDSLRAMARFRNRLVHLYWAIDDGRIHEYLQEGVEDLDRFAQAVAAHDW